MQNTSLIDNLSILIGVVIVGCVIAFLVFLKKRSRALEENQAGMTAPETVHAQLIARNKREVLGKREYFVHFRTDDGRELRLSVPYAVYLELKKPDLDFQPEKLYRRTPSGTVTYQGTALISFDRDRDTGA